MPATTRTTTGMPRADRVLLATFSAIATAIGLGGLVAGALRIRLYALAAGDGATPVSLLADAPLPGIPTAGSPRIEFGVFPTADLLVTGLSDGTRALLAVGEGLGAATAVVVSGAVAWLLLSLARGRAFARPLPALATIAGATLALGSLLGESLAGFGRMNAAVELETVRPGLFEVAFAVDPAPVLVGFAIMALAFVFRAGTRLERDTAGLV